MRILKIILIPFSLLYAMIMFIRNKLYDMGIFKTHKVDIPVISVGNITTGGSGKTPLTIFIARYFLSKNIKVGIVSRGYKRTSTGVLTAGGNATQGLDPELFGDELAMMAENLNSGHAGQFSIAASSDRIRASKLLLEKFHPGIIILDDGFQHRKIYRDLDIVVFDSGSFLQSSFDHKFTLPSGRLRESLSNLSRADILVQNEKSGDEKFPLIRDIKKDSAAMVYKTECIMDSKNRILQNKEGAIVFSGIANDRSFVQLIKNEGINIAEKIKYPDHYDYTGNDVKDLERKYSGERIFITTEKDFIKVKRFEDFISNYPVYYLKMKIEFIHNENIFLDSLNKFSK